MGRFQHGLLYTWQLPCPAKPFVIVLAEMGIDLSPFRGTIFGPVSSF